MHQRKTCKGCARHNVGQGRCRWRRWPAIYGTTGVDRERYDTMLVGRLVASRRRFARAPTEFCHQISGLMQTLCLILPVSKGGHVELEARCQRAEHDDLVPVLLPFQETRISLRSRAAALWRRFWRLTPHSEACQRLLSPTLLERSPRHPSLPPSKTPGMFEDLVPSPPGSGLFGAGANPVRLVTTSISRDAGHPLRGLPL